MLIEQFGDLSTALNCAELFYGLFPVGFGQLGV